MAATLRQPHARKLFSTPGGRKGGWVVEGATPWGRKIAFKTTTLCKYPPRVPIFRAIGVEKGVGGWSDCFLPRGVEKTFLVRFLREGTASISVVDGRGRGYGYG